MPLCGQSISHGFSAGAVIPAADLRTFNSNPGITLGGFLDLDVGGGSVFRPRIDGAYLIQKREDEAGTRYKRNFMGTSLSVDYLYHLSGSRRGVFGLAGVGLYHLEAKLSDNASEKKITANKIGGLIGLGYTFRGHWDLALRYTYTSFDSGLPSQRAISEPTVGMAILSGEYRF